MTLLYGTWKELERWWQRMYERRIIDRRNVRDFFWHPNRLILVPAVQSGNKSFGPLGGH